MKWSLRAIHSFFIGSLLVFALSCQKQSSPEITSEETRGSRELERLNACSKVNFTRGVLLYRNILDLFVCSKWDEQFPHMYQAMLKVSAESWDHLMEPVDSAFISNQQRRDRVFRNIRELDSKGGLDDLSYVIVALNETNFFDSTKAMFACVENPSDAACDVRKGRVPDKKSLKNIISLVDADPETIDNLSQFIKLMVKALDGRKEELRTEINKFRASPLYIPLRLQLVDAIASKAQKGFSDEDRTFIPKILQVTAKDGETPWIYTWIQDMKMNRDKFRDLLEYPVLANPALIGEIKSLELAYDGGVSCSIKSSSNPNDLIEFDFKTHLSEYVSVIKNRNYKEFYDYSSADIVGLKVSTEICRELEHNRYNVNFIQLITHLSEFVSEKKHYDLLKFLVSQSTAKGDPEKTFSENLYLFDLVTGDIFSSANALNTNIITSTRNFYPFVFDVVKNLPPEAFKSLGEYLAAVGQKENDTRFKGVADFWSFFTPEEKNFLFNFIDRHFDKGTDYVMLFDFYTKFLDDLREVQPMFKDKWAGSDKNIEMSYMTAQDLFSHFAGKETLLDFKKFFSRDQIIKVLEVISNGAVVNKAAKEELAYIKSDNYVLQTKSEKYKFKISYNPGIDPDYDSKSVIECMQKFADIQNGFYELVRNLPAACTKVTGANIAFQLFGWLNSVEDSYVSWKKKDSLKDSLLDSNGIMSPYMINTSLGLAKVINNLIGPYGAEAPTQNGVSYLLKSADYHLNQKGAAALVDKNLDWLNSLLNVRPADNEQHRNALIKSFTREDNFSYSQNLFSNVGKLMMEYGEWIKTGQLDQVRNRSLGKFDSQYTCEKSINQFVSPYPCPSKDIVKSIGSDMLQRLQNTWEKDQGSPIAKIMLAFKTDGGLDIPLRGKKSRKIRLSIRDLFRYLYDTSDKTYKVNRMPMKYVNAKNIKSVETVTTLERVETVIREVAFDNNYLGVSFLNAVVHAEDYNKEVDSRRGLLSKCLRVPGIRCGRKMSDDDLRMGLNALEAYDSLLDVNNGRNLDDRLQYGDFLKTFETALVASSAFDAQEVQLLPLKDEVLKKHNGKILGDMTYLTSWSNVARVIRDRIGRTREDFENFINREDFKRVDRALLYGFDLGVATPSAERLISKLRSVPHGETQNVFAHTVDWVSTLSYEETRLLEDTLARAMVVGSYLGTPEFVFGKATNTSLDRRYSGNNLFQIFTALEKLVDYWPVLKNFFPGDAKLVDALKPMNTALYFVTAKLNSTNDPAKNTAYLALNDVFVALQTSVFDQMPNPDIRQNNFTVGFDLILEMFKDPKLVASTYSLIRADYKYVDTIHQNNGEWFFSAGQNLRRVALSPVVDMAPFRDYLSFTTKKKVVLMGDTNGEKNYHYDEPANLLRFLNKRSETPGMSNFMLMNQKVFVENTIQLSRMLDDLLPCVKIKEVKAPLLLN